MKKIIKLKKQGKFVFTLLFIFSLSLFIYSSYNIFFWIKDNQKTNKQVIKIIQSIEISEVDNNEKTEIIDT